MALISKDAAFSVAYKLAAERLAEENERLLEALTSIHDSWAERRCTQADAPDFDNTCIEVGPDELEWPDDYCDRCYLVSLAASVLCPENDRG